MSAMTEEQDAGGSAGGHMTTSRCPRCKEKTQGVNGRYRCQTDETLWSTNPADGNVKPIYGK